MRIFLVILAALIVAGGTGFYVLQGLRPAAPEVAQAAAPQLRQVFVPASQVPIGTIITPEWLSRMDITEGALNGEMILADAAGQEFLAGSVARQVLPQGVPIARSFVVRPGDRGFLAAVLPKGMRAITIPIDEVAGLSGLALPGDRVDLILTSGGDDGVRASETVISNLRVLAFDQRLGPEAPPKDKEGKAEGAPVARTATLEVSSRQAEMITLAQTLGTLSLILNSVRDGGDEGEKNRHPKTDTVNLDISGPASPEAFVAPPARRQTLESDVTSTNRVKIVRGVSIRSTATAAEAPAAEAGPATSE
jgi:pilus assembly protein CpaB